MHRAAALLVALSWAGCSIYEPPAATSGTTASTGGVDTGRGGASSSGTAGAGGDDVGTTGAGGAIDIDGAADRTDDVAVPESGPGVASDGDAPNASSADVASDGRADVTSCAGYALQFGGIQAYVRVNRPVQEDFTLEAWIKAQAPGISAGAQFWQGSGLLYADAMGNTDDFGSAVLGTKFVFGVGNPDTTIASTSDVTTGAWVHVAATRRKLTGEIQVFVNGNMENAKIVTGQINSLTAQANMAIGGNAMDSRYFAGFIDEVRAWNVVRTGPEIASTMHKRLVGNEPGLVGYWRFDEGTGTLANDASQVMADGAPVKNNGDLFGAINWVPSDAPICP
jgi:hypothetical protein